MVVELDYLLKIEGVGVVTHENGSAMACQIREWIETEEGSVWGAPWWGNSLKQYRHDPHDDDTASSIESSVLLSIGRDIPHVNILRIGVEPVEKDGWKITVIIPNEIIEMDINL